MVGRKAVLQRKGATGRTRLYWPARVVDVRQRMGFSQRGMAKLIGVSVDTLQDWEQGWRQPSGPAVVLLEVLEVDAESVMRAWKQGPLTVAVGAADSGWRSEMRAAMRHLFWVPIGLLVLTQSHAADQPAYGPAPAWVRPSIVPVETNAPSDAAVQMQ
jgi:putative transcriptional regulator